MGLFKLVSCGRYVQWGVRRVAGARYCGSRRPQESADCGRDTANELSKLQDEDASKDNTEKVKDEWPVIVGVYEEGGKYVLSPYGEERDKETSGKILKRLNELESLPLGRAVVVTDVAPWPYGVLAGCGPRDAGYNEQEALHEGRENVRRAIGAAGAALRRGPYTMPVFFYIDELAAPDAAGEALGLCWRRCSYKTKSPGLFLRSTAKGTLLGDAGMDQEQAGKLYEEGKVRGYSQHWARCLSDMPANEKTPVALAKAAFDTLCPRDVKVTAHDRSWIAAQKMDAFMAVARGSCEEPYMLECEYRKGGDGPTVLVVAKGLTFDSGGLCLKNPSSMVESRVSIAGAAAALGAMHSIARNKAEVNVQLVIPLCENMVSGQCMKVGDVVRALNGRSIQIEDTDMEGRLMMADALVYGQAAYKPDYVITVAALTDGIRLATDRGAFGCFTNSDQMWELAREAGAHTGDRPWRFPLWNYYQKQLVGNPVADLNNKGSGIATPCLGAAFLNNFVCGDWLHMDTTGVAKVSDGTPSYLFEGQSTGRPTRTLDHLLRSLAKRGKKENRQ